MNKDGIEFLINAFSHITTKHIVIGLLLILAGFLICRWLLVKLSIAPKYVNKELKEIDEMSGEIFEEFAAEVLSHNGFSEIEMTKRSGDFGADIIGVYEDEKYAIQCKRYASSVGIKAVQEVIAAMKHYECDRCMVFANSKFTKQAVLLAEENEVLLVDRDKMIFLRDIARSNKESSRE